MAADEDLTRTPSATRDRTPMGALLAANAVSSIGNSLTSLSVPWFILETTGSAARTGLVGAAIALGAVSSYVMSGPVVDRVGYKRSSVLADVASGTAVLAIPLLHRAGVLEFWHLLVLGFLIAALNSPGDTARLSIVPSLAQRAALTMEQANAADRAIARVALMVGPVLAGVLIGLIGPTNVLLLDAVTFAVSAALVGFLVPAAAGSRTRSDGSARPDYRADLVAGLRFLRGSGLILSIALVATVANAMDAPLITVVLPVYAQQFWDNPTTSLGVVVSATGAGALAGTLLFARIGRRLPPRATFLGAGAVGSVLLYGLLAATPPLGVVIVAAALGGVIAGPIVPLMQTVMQRSIPPDMFGRVFGALQAVTMAAVPFAVAAAGFVIEGVGIVPTVAGMAVVYVVLTLGSFLNPALRRMDDVAGPAAADTA